MVADEREWTDEQIVEWVTILAIFLFACFPYEMIQLSETGLGKLFFVFMIIYYAMVDPVYGIIVCCIVIVYYQLDLYRSIIAIHRDTLLSENMTVMQDDLTLITRKKKEVEAFTPGESSIYSYTPVSEPKNYVETELLRGSRKKELMDNFRREYCDDKKRLKYKGGIVRPEMAEHIFREIKFPDNSSKCNPCEESCEFSIIEERLNTEEGLRPASSKDQPVDWEQFFGHYLVKPITSIADDIFSLEHKFNSMIRGGDPTK
jgi:hypothetical protein